MSSTASTRSAAGVAPVVRRIPVPVAEPPFDDERGTAAEPAAATQGTLALDLSAQPLEPAPVSAARPRHLRVVPEGGPHAPADTFFARQPTPRIALPDPRSWSGRFAQALVEVLTGRRAINQLMRWTDERVYAELQRLVRASAASRSGRDTARPLVRSVHVCEPQDGVVEAAVHVRHEHRSRAIAVRLEGLDGRWRCTALHLG